MIERIQRRLLLEKREEAFDNKKEKLRSVTEKENEFLRRLKEGKVYFSEGELYEDIPDGIVDLYKLNKLNNCY